MALVIEKIYPIAFGIFSSIIYLLFFRNYSLSGSVTNLFSSTVTISSIAVGFLAATKAILFSIQEHKFIKQLKQSDAYYILVNYLMTSIYFCFITSIVSAFLLLIDLKRYESFAFCKIFFAIWLFLAIASVLSCFRIIRIFDKILRI